MGEENCMTNFCYYDTENANTWIKFKYYTIEGRGRGVKMFLGALLYNIIQALFAIINYIILHILTICGYHDKQIIIKRILYRFKIDDMALASEKNFIAIYE